MKKSSTCFSTNKISNVNFVSSQKYKNKISKCFNYLFDCEVNLINVFWTAKLNKINENYSITTRLRKKRETLQTLFTTNRSDFSQEKKLSLFWSSQHIFDAFPHQGHVCFAQQHRSQHCHDFPHVFHCGCTSVGDSFLD